MRERQKLFPAEQTNRRQHIVARSEREISLNEPKPVNNIGNSSKMAKTIIMAITNKMASTAKGNKRNEKQG